MRNPISTAYNVLDNTIMYFVNEGVHLWNWTTGRTKSDLASLVDLSGCVSSSVGASYIGGFVGITSTIIMTGYGYVFVKHAYMHEREEIENAEKETMSLVLEFDKKIYEFVGLNLTSLGLVSSLIAIDADNDPTLLMMGIGLGLIGISGYIMRADSPPPRKNVLSRARDKLVDIVREYKRKPAFEQVRY